MIKFNLLLHLGDKDKSTLKWVKSIYKKYKADCLRSTLEAIEKLLQIPAGQFEILTSLSKAAKNISLDLKTFSLPFTESILESLSVFDSKFQRNILEVRAQSSILSEIRNTKEKMILR